MLVDGRHGLPWFFAGRSECAHHLEEPPVLAMDFEQRVTPAARAFDRPLAIGGVILGMAAAPALPPKSPDFEHSLTVYHFPVGRYTLNTPMMPGGEKTPKTRQPDTAPQVRAHMDRILASPAFRGSKRCQEFLQFVVDEALEGDLDNLKERTLATEVFGRSAGADLTDDSIVRVGAREVRKRLAQYYAADGASDVVRIELPSGSYVPVFHLPKLPQAPAQPAVPQPRPAPTAPPVRPAPVPNPPPAASVAPVRVLAPKVPEPPPPPLPAPPVPAATAVPEPAPAPAVVPVPERVPMAPEPLTDRRRAPLWGVAAALILLATGAVIAWQSYRHAPGEFDSFWQPLSDQSVVVAIPPAADGFVRLADAETAFELAGVIATRSSRVDLRTATEPGSTAVLVGANQLTADVTGRLRFAVVPDPPSIADTTNPSRHWTIGDYALICRLNHAINGKVTIVAAGQRVGRILADPALLVPLVKQLPSNWEQQNVELILRSNGAATPELIDKQIW